MSDQRIAALLLVLAAIASACGAGMPSLNRERVWLLPLHDYLRVIRAHETAWRAHAWCFAAGTLLLGVGLGLLARSLGSGLALAAAVLYWLVAPLWLADLAFRLDITVWAAREPEPPALFAALGHWAGTLYNVFMIGSFAAIALLGAALAEGGLVPAWTAWALVAIGAVAALSHWAGRPGLLGMRSPFDLPVLVQLLPLFVAIPLAFAG